LTELEFLSPDSASPEAVWRSPLERALANAPEEIEDISRTAKIEIRGNVDALDLDAEIVRVAPRRALVLAPYEQGAELRARLRAQVDLVLDVTAKYAGLRVRGDALMRRITDLDLDELPAVGSVAHVQAFVLRDEGDSFRLFFPQEYSDYIAGIVVDAAEGLSE
jgi:sarcosine oxidase gamma subunit